MLRRPLALLTVSFALSTAALLLAPSEASACSCMGSPPPLEAAQRVDLVFHGKLVSVADEPKSDPHALGYKIFTFDVVRTFKGQVDAQVNVRTTDNSAACGRAYGDPDSEWLIYARVDDQGRTHDNLCSRTMDIASAEADIAELEANADKLDQEPPEPEPVEPADPEPEPVMPPADDGADDGPEPAAPGKKGCAITEPEPGNLAGLLGLGLVLGWAHRRRRAARP